MQTKRQSRKNSFVLWKDCILHFLKCIIRTKKDFELKSWDLWITFRAHVGTIHNSEECINLFACCKQTQFIFSLSRNSLSLNLRLLIAARWSPIHWANVWNSTWSIPSLRSILANYFRNLNQLSYFRHSVVCFRRYPWLHACHANLDLVTVLTSLLSLM